MGSTGSFLLAILATRAASVVGSEFHTKMWPLNIYLEISGLIITCNKHPGRDVDFAIGVLRFPDTIVLQFTVRSCETCGSASASEGVPLSGLY